MIRAFQNFLDEMNIPSFFTDNTRTMIEFTIGDITYLFLYRVQEDPTYIRIMLPNAGAVNETDPQVLRTVYNLSTSFKLGKAIVNDGQIWFVTEAFIYERDNLTQLFQRMISVLRDMFNNFRTHNNG